MNANKSDWITTVIRDISELGERTSPDDFPDAMLVTAEELRCILTRVAPAPVEQAAPSEVQRIAFDRLRTAVGLSDACDETVLMLNAAVRIERLTAEASQAAPVTVPNLPERVIDTLWQAAGLTTFHPDGSQQEKFYAFARNVEQEVIARLAAAPAAPSADAQAVRIRALEAAGFELTARLCAIGVVAEKDGYELIRRESVMEFVTKWRMARDAALSAQKKGE